MPTANYTMGKILENQLLEYLNSKQPFQYYDTFTNTDLPLAPYYPSLYRYSFFDIYNDYTTFELKSRSIPKADCLNNLLDTNKVLSNHSIFMFSYDNPKGVLSDLTYIQYDKSVFSSLTIQTTTKGAELFIIPHDTVGLTLLPLTSETHSHKININFTDEYQDSHNRTIATDRTKYISTFGYYAL